VTTLTLSSQIALDASARVNSRGLADNETVLNELADVLARVRHADLRGLIGIEPDLALTNAKDGSGEALLQP
jgi:hypothetical protein